MHVLTAQQLHAAIAQLDQGQYNHDQWYRNLLRVLIARVPADPPDLLPDAHRRCRFGQWYDSVSDASLEGHPLFISLGKTHEQMHIAARSLLEQVTHDFPVAPNELDQFTNLLDRMRLEVQALRHEFVELLQNRDTLTGARTRSGLLADLREQHALAERGVQQCALAMIDLDHFKLVNDEYGHSFGDLVLFSTAQSMLAQLRQYDRLYRYGGEEFLICMPGASLEQATQAAERMRAALAALKIGPDRNGKLIQQTASFGVARLDPTRSIEESIDHADKAMYAAKAAGRNRVMAEA